MWFFFSDVEVCPLLVEISGVVRVVEWSPRGRAYPVESRFVLTGEGRFLFILRYCMGRAGFRHLSSEVQ